MYAYSFQPWPSSQNAKAARIENPPKRFMHACRKDTKEPMRQAIEYALSNWKALFSYTEAGFLAIDNNVAERALRGIALGCRNWLFCASDRGGRAAAIHLFA